MLLILSCNKTKTLFVQLSSSHTGITFNNKITENDSINPIDLEFLYNGGGVAVGDFNNDGLHDLYFTASTTSNKLYLNEGNLKFKDITEEAKVDGEGEWSTGASVVDINNDGWKDVYVTNDFLGRDHLWINNRNRTFTDEIGKYFKHTSQNAMGIDIADINNDGLPDVVAVDMDPEDNYRKQKNMSGNSYFIEQNMLNENLELQYVRNTLQLNMGNAVGQNDSVLHPVFADIGFYAGVAQTDWSWNPSCTDFDNDGFKDLMITNGYPRDVTDHDFAAYRSHAQNASKQQIIDQIPQIKISNYAFKNTGNLKFENVTQQWGIDKSSFSYGAVYVDLDNDGDLDYVVNNINDKAFVYENTTNTKNKTNKNYLEIQFHGGNKNRFGLGAIATIYYAHGKKQRYENSPYRGYLSTVDTKAFLGLDTTSIINSVVIDWTNTK